MNDTDKARARLARIQPRISNREMMQERDDLLALVGPLLDAIVAWDNPDGSFQEITEAAFDAIKQFGAGQ